MFFKKKKENLGDQFAVFQEREMPRFSANAGISIEGFEGEGLLKNISTSGGCLESVTYVAITPNQSYQVTINPGEGSNIKPFTVKLKVNWTKSSEMLFEAGLSLEEGQGAMSKNHLLERYVEQLKLQGVKPEYGNMGHGHR